MSIDVVLLTEQILSFIALYVVVTIGLNIKAGATGIPDFGHAMFFAMGGIAVGNLVAHVAAALAAIQAPELGIGPEDVLANNTWAIKILNDRYFPYHPLESIMLIILSLVLAIVLGGALGLLASYPGLRLRGEYLAILLLTAAEALRIFATYTTWIMGDEPTVGLTRPNLFAWAPDPGLVATVFTVLVAIGVYVYAQRLHNSPIGRLLRAVRDEEDAAKALGKDVAAARRDAMVIGSAIAGLAGALYALNPWLGAGAIASESIFNRLFWTFWPWALMILGGMASNRGVALAAIIVGVTLLWPIRIYKKEIAVALGVQALGIDVSNFANALEYMLIGALIVLVLFLRPQGVIPEEPSRTLPFESIALARGMPAAIKEPAWKKLIRSIKR
jgi:branched-chain amino acid transport system permease protein